MVFYQIIHRRQTRQVASGHVLTWDEWRLVMSGKDGGPRISSVREGIGLDIDRLRRIAAWFQRKPEGFSADDVAAEFRRLDAELRLDRFVDNVISDLLRLGKPRTAETYRAAAASFARFRGAVGAEHSLRLDHLTADI
ncbi:MAG: hypothetical protein K2G30_00520, partial [Muribaculaceae bacterium]|nr:hypothetical protein [Muribaculaceae bacterium]